MKMFLTSCLALTATVAVAVASPRPEKPNVVLILIDDLGWQDVKCYDIDEPSPMETPNMDALAKKGVMFWQAYSPSPVCAPSRAAILSGMHPARIEMTHVAGGQPPHAGHRNAGQISPWYSARMPVRVFTLAEAMKAEGYVTAHSGKWHISQHHYDYPNPYDHGFDQSTHHRGVQQTMKPDRLTGFATRDAKDPFRLDENGIPFDVPQDAAMRFIRENKDRPFFLYYATWLVHAPIVMRSEELLRKYEKKLGVTLTDEHKHSWKQPGQTNPFYCAMVEQLDYYLGQVFTYLETTDDPRWPGHKLVENTYIIFTSDNGGMEGGGKEVYTDNYPLDRGKISLREGGTRVPLIITGPGIPAGVKTDVMVNGLDFYPTILSWVGAKKPAGKIFDGCDIAPLLNGDPTDASLVRDSRGRVRDTMVWHFPQAENTSSIRSGDHKLLRAYRGLATERYLHRLYYTKDGEAVRGDIEEQKDLAADMPDAVSKLDARMDAMIEEMGGRLPYFNPVSGHPIPGKEKVPTVLGHKQRGRSIEVTYRDNGSAVVLADLIYTPNDGREWLRASGRLTTKGNVTFDLPAGTTHYFINLVDANHFLVVYPMIDRQEMKKAGQAFKDVAIFAGYPQPEQGAPVDLAHLYAQRSAAGNGAAVLLAEDFEGPGKASFDTASPGLSVTNSVAAAGRYCIRFFEAKDLPRAWMPIIGRELSLPADGEQPRTYVLSFDVMLDADAPGSLSILLRDQEVAKPYAGAGNILVSDGAIRVGNRALSAIDPGTWYHIEVACQSGTGRDQMLKVSATTADGRRAQGAVRMASRIFNRPTSINLAGLGTPESIVYIDNVVLRSEAR